MKTKIIILAIIFLSLFSTLASAQEEARPGDYVNIKVTNLELSTKGWPVIGIVTGGWTPAYVKWYLIDPYGNTVYMIDKSINSVNKMSGAGIGESKFQISDDAGLIEIPAFATYGMWTVKAKFYDVNKIGFITWSNSQGTTILAPIYVGDSGWMDSLGAPMYVYWNIMGFEISFATPDVLFLIAIIVVVIIVLINIMAFLGRRKRKHA